MGNLLYRKAAATSLQSLSTSATNKTTALSKVLGELWDCWSPSALRRWMIAGPELTRITSEFEKSEISRDMHVQITRHHDQLPSIQHTFVKEVKALTETISDMGNPFLETSQDLLVLDTRDIVDPLVAKTVRTAEKLGKEQLDRFIEEQLLKSVIPITDTISKNKLQLFKSPLFKAPRTAGSTKE